MSGKATEVMERLGIKWMEAHPQPIFSAWKFVGCTNVPEILPAYLSELEVAPPAQPAPVQKPSQREFENWLRGKWTAGYACQKLEGRYTDKAAQSFWECWQAATVPPAAQPAPVVCKHEWFRTGAMKPGEHRCIKCGMWNTTTPPAVQWQRVELTDEERWMCRSCDTDEAIVKTEAKLKEKNT